jgi:hypothetical protein
VDNGCDDAKHTHLPCFSVESSCETNMAPNRSMTAVESRGLEYSVGACRSVGDPDDVTGGDNAFCYKRSDACRL